MKREFCALLILILICPLFFEDTLSLGYNIPQGKSTVLYDRYHTFHENTYSRFNSILSNQFTIEYNNESLTKARLSNCDILVIPTPIEAFSREEIYNIKEFVAEGGGLLLMGNGWYWVDYHKKPIEDFPFNQIGREFGVTINNDAIVDPTDFYTPGDPGFTIFTIFVAHPVTEGLTKIHSGIPSSLSITGNAVPIVRGDEDSYSGYHEPIYKAGDFPPFAAALEYGKGRAIFAGHDQFIGTDLDKYDNLEFGMNIFDWLTPLDNDGDGYSPPDDCNDNDPSIYPGASEICDGKDNNCNGEVDEEFDKDNDGYTTCNGDCNDNDPDINPGASEICNDNKDNNCDGYTDCSDSDCSTSSHCDHDKDDDGYDSTAYGGNDCDDNDPDINPGASEICNDNKDNDCDGSTDCSDSDCANNGHCDHDKDDDGYNSTAYGGNDCDDNDPDINPGAPEICNDNKDNDCDGSTDCSDSDCSTSSHCDHDNDNDGYDGTAYGGDDCDDNDPDINPGAPEICEDNKDNDCDGSTDCSDPDCANNSHCIDKGNLEILVVDHEGKGLKAIVYMNGSYKGETDSAGTLTISNLEADKEYTMKAEVPGYNPKEKTVTVQKNTTKQVKIQMENGEPPWLIIVLLLSSLGLVLLVLKFRNKLKKGTPKSKLTQMYCPHCGNKVERTWDSCLHCGCDLRDYTQIYDEDTQPY
jgi:hypothetical protein